jgi:choline dehydrogenase-like flavoprotein
MMDHPRIWHGDVTRRSDQSAVSRFQIKREKRGLYKTGIRNKLGSSRVYCNLMTRRSRFNRLIDYVPSESFQYSFRKLLAREKGILKASVNEILKWHLISESNGLNQDLENFFNCDSDQSFDLMTYCEQRPMEENHIRLKKENDRNGLPIPFLESKLHKDELKEVTNFYSFLESYLRDLNCQLNYDLEYLTNPANYTDAAHLMGGTRYSNQPERSVLEKDLSVKGIPNLHITGSSAFPTSGVENPTHLILSLSCYLAEVLKRKFE